MIAEEENGIKRFYSRDHLGSTRLVTDSVGYGLQRLKYDPYGQLITLPNDACLISDTIPTTMIAGQSYSISITLKNTGTNAWSEG